MNKPEYAGFWVRFGAEIIDLIMVMIVTGVPLTFIYGPDFWKNDNFTHGLWGFFLGYVVPFVTITWFWRRFASMLVIAISVVMTLIHGVEYWSGNTSIIYGFWDLLLIYIFPFVATIWFWLRFFGTPGKMALKLKIVDASTGNRLSLGQSVGRYLAYILSAIPLGLGFIWVGIDRKKQGER